MSDTLLVFKIMYDGAISDCGLSRHPELNLGEEHWLLKSSLAMRESDQQDHTIA